MSMHYCLTLSMYADSVYRWFFLSFKVEFQMCSRSMYNKFFPLSCAIFSMNSSSIYKLASTTVLSWQTAATMVVTVVMVQCFRNTSGYFLIKNSYKEFYNVVVSLLSHIVFTITWLLSSKMLCVPSTNDNADDRNKWDWKPNFLFSTRSYCRSLAMDLPKKSISIKRRWFGKKIAPQ